ncbi:hypothetical protein HH800_28890 (plasmid) [Sphingobium yanoikuyae]|uniref:Oligosaccharide repeat unit polymerase n=2 Tax=Pseudomonadota TaxID=1224 RepID=A0A6M4GGH0_SPHYA|nr:hypothetical protein [Sphingobium yanoikuyae]QJR06240.1 hypothetical protein HH800_28890 [Sphingobium yanoikuyae]
MGLVFGLIIPIVTNEDNYGLFVGYGFVRSNINNVYIHTISATIALIGIQIGWKINPIKSSLYYFYNINHNSISKYLLLILIVSFLSQYLYTIDYGGFVGYFDYNRLIRAGMFDSFERSRFSFLSPFSNLSIVSCLGFIGLIISGRTNFLNIAGFAIALLFSCYVLYAAAGRIAMISLLAVVLAAPMVMTRRKYTSWIFGYFFVIFFGIIAIYNLSWWLDLKSSNNISSYVLNEFSFPFVSFFAQLEQGFHFYSFVEVALSPLYLLPSSLTSEWLIGAEVRNTIIVMGSAKGVGGNTAGIPTDMITFGFMQLHILGVFFYSIIIGYIIKLSYALANSFQEKGMRIIFTSYILFRICPFIIFYSHPKHIISTNFGFIFIIIIRYIYIKVRFFRI